MAASSISPDAAPITFCGVSALTLELAARNAYRWRQKRALSYFWADRIAGLDPSKQAADTAWAFDQWSAASNRFLTFSPAGQRATADIVLTSARIDGMNGVLADMQLPPGDDRPLLGRFDTGEAWDRSVRFALVLLHELGHAMGLDHIKGVVAVLNPMYNPGLSRLQQPDIDRLLNIYPEAVTYVPPPAPVPEPQPVDPSAQVVINVNLPAGLPAGNYRFVGNRL